MVTNKIKFSIVIPCYNEEKTLKKCVERVLDIADEHLLLEIILVDDSSTDRTKHIVDTLEKNHPEIIAIHHNVNKGKGAALRTGFSKVTGDFVAVQDADLEYDPKDLKRLLEPLERNLADVVFGSRFLSSGAHRVLYFWHSIGNKFLTLLSNMFTDLNITDMETCYKVFRREIIRSINIEENRFGFEPEIVAKVAHKRLRIYEMGISYYGRTYAEGKKIGIKDGLRALYCIFRYNSHRAPIPVQFLIYTFIGGLAAIVNFIIFLSLFNANISVNISAPAAFIIAAIVNYFLCISLLFRHKIRWGSKTEILIYFTVVLLVAFIDLILTKAMLNLNIAAGISKIIASIIVLVLNFIGRRYWVFYEPSSGSWRPQIKDYHE